MSTKSSAHKICATSMSPTQIPACVFKYSSRSERYFLNKNPLATPPWFTPIRFLIRKLSHPWCFTLRDVFEYKLRRVSVTFTVTLQLTIKPGCEEIFPTNSTAVSLLICHDDIMARHCFQHYCLFLHGNHESPVDSPHKETIKQRFFLIAWTSCSTKRWNCWRYQMRWRHVRWIESYINLRYTAIWIAGVHYRVVFANAGYC